MSGLHDCGIGVIVCIESLAESESFVCGVKVACLQSWSRLLTKSELLLAESESLRAESELLAQSESLAYGVGVVACRVRVTLLVESESL